jgi:hypothetical protein
MSDMWRKIYILSPVEQSLVHSVAVSGFCDTLVLTAQKNPYLALFNSRRGNEVEKIEFPPPRPVGSPLQTQTNFLGIIVRWISHEFFARFWLHEPWKLIHPATNACFCLFIRIGRDLGGWRFGGKNPNEPNSPAAEFADFPKFSRGFFPQTSDICRLFSRSFSSLPEIFFNPNIHIWVPYHHHWLQHHRPS